MTSRFWLGATVAVTLVVMGGMVAWGLRERRNPRPDAPFGRYGPARVGSVAPDRAPEMPEGCDVDPARPPKLVFDLQNDVLDVGPMRQGQKLDREVTVRNVGSGPLCVSQVQTGCGCVRAEMPGSRRIDPTETATLRVTVDIDFNRSGLQQKDVRLYTNEPGRPVATFRVNADVRLGVVLLDPSAPFGRLMRGKPGEARVRLRSPAEDAAWEVTAVEGTKGAYAFTVTEATPEPAFRVLEVRIAHPGDDRIGPWNDTLKIRTTHPERAEVVVHGSATIVDRYFASPAEVPFGYLAREVEGTWYPVRILAADPTGSVPLAGARIEGEGFEVGEKRPAGAGEWLVYVRPVTKGVEGGKLKATLVVDLDDPVLPTVRVPLRLEVLSRVAPARGRPTTTARGM